MTNLPGLQKMTIEVVVQDARESTDDEVPPSSSFTLWANLAAADMDRSSALTIRVVDEEESRQLNHRYRGKDRPTNVLSFSYGAEDLPDALDAARLLGDLVICASIVRREAEENRRPVNDHWAHLTIHGVLHLLGYDHDTPQHADEMEALEISLLHTLNIHNPYMELNDQ